MQDYLKRKDDIEDAEIDLVGNVEDVETAWRVYLVLASVNNLGWHVLPYAGGVLDQPEVLLTNLLSIHAYLNKLEEARRGG